MNVGICPAKPTNPRYNAEPVNVPPDRIAEARSIAEARIAAQEGLFGSVPETP